MAARQAGRGSGPRRGTGRGGARLRGARRAGAVALASGLVLGTGTTLAPAAAFAAQTRYTVGDVHALGTGAVDASATSKAPEASGGGGQAVVTLDTITPQTPSVTNTVTLTGTVTNKGSTSISSLHVGVWADTQPLTSRSEISAVAALTGPNDQDPAELDKSGLQPGLGTLAPGATSAPFTIAVKISDLGLSAGHVYELAVDAQGSVSGSSVHPLGVARTFLPLYDPGSGAQPTKIATLWPVVAAPRVQPQTYSDSKASDQAVLSDDTLADDLGTDGRLGQLQSRGASIAALKPTWVIDPDLITSVLDMESAYQVAGSGGDAKGATTACKCTTAGSGSAAAKTWLADMQQTLSGLSSQQVLSLPAGDPDLASIAHNGSGSQSLKDALKVATSDLGQVGLNPLQVSASRTVAWPYQGYIDSSVVSLARSIGSTQIITDSSSLPDSRSLTYTPNAARSLGNGTTAVVADSTIDDIFAGNLSTQSAQTMAEQRFLAETLAITLERPNDQRSILVMPPRDMVASTAQTLANSLAAAVTAKWAKAAGYGEVASATPTPHAGTIVPSVSDYPSAARKTELSSGDLTAVTSTQDNLAELGKIMSNPAPIRTAFSSAVLRSVSTQWRDQSDQGTAYRENATEYLDNLHDAVSILHKPNNSITLSGSGSATIPITVQNDLPQPVLNLEVELTSSSPTRLSLDKSSPNFKLMAVRANGDTVETLRFPVTATANGQVEMTAQLYTTADQKPYGNPVSFTVDIKQLRNGVIAVVAGGVLLVLLAGVRLYSKRKHARSGEGADGGAAEGDDAEDADAERDDDARDDDAWDEDGNSTSDERTLHRERE
ncbi:DUF6049 family protein [Streptacidiphilus carbonis]|uniref:DUF6049 family protein n=1 Tax=Streptacidiphilus carbonis TaxID=105422 RepID=UPI001377937C|nr:DUF6049 family protein [Streptacidiphilus carbonis]